MCVPDKVQIVEPPLPPALIEELITLWDGIFGTGNEHFRTTLNGSETDATRDVVSFIRDGSQPVGTAHLTISRRGPRLGGLGEVATSPEFRRQGHARQLVTILRDEFLSGGGEALFLSTVNPHAERLYHQLGWRKLENATVMCLVADGQLPGNFLSEYFQTDSLPTNVQVTAGRPQYRSPMIPLILSAHTSPVLDANIDLISTRYAVQNACMSLYPLYEALRAEGRGEWFAAVDAGGRVLGLGTVRLRRPKTAQVDAFADEAFSAEWSGLMEAALDWSHAHRVEECYIDIADGDQAIRDRLMALGFVTSGSPAQTSAAAGKIILQRMTCRLRNTSGI